MTSKVVVVAVAWVSPTTSRPAATRKEPSGEKLNLGMDHFFEGRQARDVGKNGKIYLTYDTYVVFYQKKGSFRDVLSQTARVY